MDPINNEQEGLVASENAKHKLENNPKLKGGKPMSSITGYLLKDYIN